MQNPITDTARCQVHGKFTITNPDLRQKVIHLFVRGYREKARYTYKSLSCMGEDTGLMSSEQESLVTASPASHRKSLHNIKKSFSLRQKQSFTGPTYVNIDSQGNV